MRSLFITNVPEIQYYRYAVGYSHIKNPTQLLRDHHYKSVQVIDHPCALRVLQRPVSGTTKVGLAVYNGSPEKMIAIGILSDVTSRNRQLLTESSYKYTITIMKV